VLWLGGAGLARGYLDRPDLTAERFVPDPWGEVPGARLYRTGDRARFGMDGRLHFLGRLDRQVKVRGFRIELGELEAVLAAHPRVREAVVLARQDSPEEVRLVAYVVASPAPAGRGEEPAPPESPGLPEQLRAHLADLLPSHMIPAAFVLLAALPLSPTGKVDRRALPAPEWRPEPGGIPPRTPLEEVIAGLFAEVLGVERVGVRDSFFHLGGHSLKAVQLASRLRAIFKVELPVRSLFETPTVEALATAVAAGEPRPGQSEKLARVLLRVKQGSLPRR
jgi:acyl carrier protein